jgi:uncharacterized protein (DUF1501 family)
MLDPDISTAEALAHLSRLEQDAGRFDRRRFLQLVGMGVGAGAVASTGGSLLNLGLPGLDPAAWAAGPIGPDDGVLVVLGMFGGNDGLNTVVPFTDGDYRTQHGSLALGGNQVLQLDANTGLHPALTEFKRFWDAGKLAIVEGVGYPNPDLSHFSSMAKWMAGRPSGIPSTGWIGRWLDGYVGAGKDLFAAAEIGRSVPLHLIGERQRATAVPAGRPGFGGGTEARQLKLYAGVRALGVSAPAGWTGRIGEAMIDQLDVADRLVPIVPERNQMPAIDLAADMEVMARLINANLGLRVLSTGWGDFDSHAGQPNMHPIRMQELNAAIARFFQILDPAWSSRVTIMTFSEFGRTSWSNDGAGTDHGTSAPHFVLGANVRGGFHGQRPSLAGLRRWDRMPFHVDLRDYYGSVLDGWLGGGSSTVLDGHRTDDLGLFRRGPGGSATTPPPVTGGGGAGGASGGGSGGAPSVPWNFVPAAPRRILDSRNGTGGRTRPIAAGETLTIQVAGRNGVPAAAGAVAVNITSVGATSPTFFTAYPSGTPRPDTSTLNPWPGRATPNMAFARLGPDGRLCIFNRHGASDVVVDVMGWFVPEPAAGFQPLVPARLLDTRRGLGAAKQRLRGGSTIELTAAGRGGVPATGAEAVVLNVAAVDPTRPGYIGLWPTGLARPTISNLNYAPGRNVANLVICKLGRNGKVSLYGHSGELDVVADVVGYFGGSGTPLVGVGPSRLLDTRIGLGTRRGPVAGGSEIDLRVTGTAGVDSAARAVVLNVTAVEAPGPSYVTVYPDGVRRPTSSSVNLNPGDTVANLVVAKVGAGGRVRLYNHSGAVHLVADVMGYFR